MLRFLAPPLFAGADPGFQVRGSARKKIAPSGGRRENFGGISCEKSRFYAKKSIFSQLRRRENCWGISCEKSRFYAKNSYFFPILGGGAGCIRPWFVEVLVHLPSQESTRAWVLLLEESSLLQFLIFLLHFGNVQSAIFLRWECRSLNIKFLLVFMESTHISYSLLFSLECRQKVPQFLSNTYIS